MSFLSLKQQRHNTDVLFSDAPDSYYYRTAKVGQTVKFRCPTKLPEDVDWVRLATPHSREEFIYLGNVGPHHDWSDPRFTVLDGNHSHSLVIYNVTVNDSAYYRCVEDAGLGNRHFYRLKVEGKFIGFFSECVRRSDNATNKQTVHIFLFLIVWLANFYK